VLCRAKELAQRVKLLKDNIQDLKAESRAVEVQQNLAQVEADDKLKALTNENSILMNRCMTSGVSWFCCCIMSMRADCVTWYYTAHTRPFLINAYVWGMHHALLSPPCAYKMKTWHFFTSCQTDLHQKKLLLDEKAQYNNVACSISAPANW